MRQIAVLCLSLCLSGIMLVGCGGETGGSPATLSIPPADSPESPESAIKGLANADAIIANPELLPRIPPRENLHPEVVIVTTLGEIRVRLDAEKASETVDNFLENYVDRDFYTGTIFHYVEAGFIAIGGGYTKEMEFMETKSPIRNEAFNGLKNRRGTIAMSRQVDYADSGTSQFFFNLADNESLDHQPEGGDDTFGYCVFGEVVSGLEVLDKLAQVQVSDRNDFHKIPVDPVVIESVDRVTN